MDWRDRLQAFAEANPDLPEGPADEPSGLTPARETSQPRLDIWLERKGRKGKSATLIGGWTLSDDDLLQVASRLKSALGSGGSARGGEILIQGDRRDDVLRALSQMGYKCRII